jgi:histidinol dehydrogenase
MQKLEFSDTPKFKSALRRFCAKANVTSDLAQVVSAILRDIHDGGDRAVLEATQRFDVRQLDRSRHARRTR